MDPAVSVIIPAYNTQAYIGTAIASVLGQQYTDFEIIVVDDASTDGTAETVRAIDDPRLRLIRLPVNAGAAVARNRALSEARGRWIALLDSDDWYDATRLATLVERAERAEADLYADDILLVRDGESAPWSSLRRESGQTITGPFMVDAETFVTTDIYDKRCLRLGLSKPLMRRSFLEQHGLRYDPALRMGQDFWLYLECLLRGGRFIVDPEGYYYYRSRPDSLVKQSQDSRLELYCRAASAFLARPEVQARPCLADAIRRNLRLFKRSRAYYRVVEPIKRRQYGPAMLAAIANPMFFVYSCSRMPGAIARRICANLRDKAPAAAAGALSTGKNIDNRGIK